MQHKFDRPLNEFLRAYSSRNALSCYRAILNATSKDNVKPDPETLEEFALFTADQLRGGLYSTNPIMVDWVKKLGLIPSVELLGALLSEDILPLEVSLLRAVANHCTPKTVSKEVKTSTEQVAEFQKEQKEVQLEQALEKGAEAIGNESSVPLSASEALQSFFNPKKVS